MNYHDKRFRVVSSAANGEVDTEMTFHYIQHGNVLTASYSGGSIKAGQLIGLVDGAGNIDMRYQQVNLRGEIMTGVCRSRPEVMDDDRIRLHEEWQWTSGDMSSGSSILEEV